MLFANLSTSFHSFVAESRFWNEIVRWIQLYTLFGMPSVEHAHYNAAANIASYRSEYWRRNRMWFCYFGQINRNAIMRHNIHTVLYANPSNRPKAAAPVRMVGRCYLLPVTVHSHRHRCRNYCRRRRFSVVNSIFTVCWNHNRPVP